MKVGDLVVYTGDDAPPRGIGVVVYVEDPQRWGTPGVMKVNFTNVSGRSHWYFLDELKLVND